jgi:prolyl oligopeptidase
VNRYGPEVLVRFESFLVPPTIFADRGGAAPVAIRSLPPRFDATQFVTEQFSAVSKDGTRVPYFVVRNRVHRGPNPTLLMGYGGYEVPLVPSYLETLFQVWVQRGGSLVVANIRGGGEFGPSWHDAAVGANRQKSFDDFAAIARDLSTRGLTTPKQLGVLGGSNGGLLVATVMTQQPDILGAVICAAPLTDMLRYTKIGAGASWIGEYGDPADPTIAAALRAYSPYQHVAAGRRYPPVLFLTATSDDRVTPVHARKMAARMAAQGHDVLFYENTDGGHGLGDHKQNADTDGLILHFVTLKLGSAATGTAP